MSPEGEKTRKIKRQRMANSLSFLALPPTPTHNAHSERVMGDG